MPIASNALVLVTDGRKTLLFRNHGDANQIDLRTEAHDERVDLSDGEMKTDAAGSGSQSGGYGRPTYDETDFHKLEEDRWAKHAAEEVNKRALSNDFDTLAIIAPPKTLGELRKQLHKEAIKRVVCEIPKEMTGHTIADIEKLIVSVTKAEEPEAV
ncbi:MAG: host attachment family protein [Sphingomicrobium sp.]